MRDCLGTDLLALVSTVCQSRREVQNAMREKGLNTELYYQNSDLKQLISVTLSSGNQIGAQNAFLYRWNPLR